QATVPAPFTGGGFVNGAACTAPQLAEGGEGINTNAPSLTQAELAPLAQQAIARWAATGLSSDKVAQLNAASITIADLPAGYLGETTGNAITLDPNAASWGWYIDQTP